jgi:hypothetical protein
MLSARSRGQDGSTAACQWRPRSAQPRRRRVTSSFGAHGRHHARRDVAGGDARVTANALASRVAVGLAVGYLLAFSEEATHVA